MDLAEEVGLQHPPVDLYRDVLEATVGHDAGVVDPGLSFRTPRRSAARAPARSPRRRCPSGRPAPFPPAASHSPAASLRLTSLLAASTTRAVLGEEPRRRPFDAARGAGHDDHGALYLPRHPTRTPPWFREDRRGRTRTGRGAEGRIACARRCVAGPARYRTACGPPACTPRRAPAGPPRSRTDPGSRARQYPRSPSWVAGRGRHAPRSRAGRTASKLSPRAALLLRASRFRGRLTPGTTRTAWPPPRGRRGPAPPPQGSVIASGRPAPDRHIIHHFAVVDPSCCMFAVRLPIHFPPSLREGFLRAARSR